MHANVVKASRNEARGVVIVSVQGFDTFYPYV